MADNFITECDEEKRLIIEKYEKGREKINKEDLKEEEEIIFKIIHRTDKYGFIHEDELPEKLTKYENRICNLEVSRADKWLKMINNWKKYKNKMYDKLRDRVFKGIPQKMRGEAWLLLLEIHKTKAENSTQYEEMYDLGKQYSKEVRQIDLDINRTFRNHIFFKDRYDIKQQELFRVLVAYSVYNSEIGYCQGMSQIAALLLMFMTEEDAFWALDRLMTHEKYAMHGIFIPGFPKFHRLNKHHDLVLKKFLPRLYKRFQEYKIDPTIYTCKWFFQCFLDRVPFSLTLRLWDCFMIDGELILTCFSYTLLKLHKKSILKKGMEDLIQFLNNGLEKDFGYHDDEAIIELQKSILELRRYKMDVPLESASDLEKPSKPFGLMLSKADVLSLINDDRSIVGSICIKPDDTASTSHTFRTNSDGEDDFNENNFTNENNSDVVNINSFQRKLSIYDNVDLNESFNAAKNLVLEENIENNILINSEKSFKNETSLTDNEEKNFSSNEILNHSLNLSINQQTTGKIYQNTALENVRNKELFNSNEDLQNNQIMAKKKDETINTPLNKRSQSENNSFKQIISENSENFNEKSKENFNNFNNSLPDKNLKRRSSIPKLKNSRVGNFQENNNLKKENKNNKSIIKSNSITSSSKISSIPKFTNSSIGSNSSKNHQTNRQFTRPNLVLDKNNKDEIINESLNIDQRLDQVNRYISDSFTCINSENSKKKYDSTKVRIYVPYAKLNSRNNSENNLSPASNNVNSTSNSKISKKEDDLNKITINVHQKYSDDYQNFVSNNSEIKNKSYLPKIDT